MTTSKAALAARAVITRMSDMEDEETLKKVSNFLSNVEAGASFEAAVKVASLRITYPDLSEEDWLEVLPILDEEAWGWLSS
jgi:hypothetical protein